MRCAQEVDFRLTHLGEVFDSSPSLNRARTHCIVKRYIINHFQVDLSGSPSVSLGDLRGNLSHLNKTTFSRGGNLGGLKGGL